MLLIDFIQNTLMTIKSTKEKIESYENPICKRDSDKNSVNDCPNQAMNDILFDNTRQDSQKSDLGTRRAVSSIPKCNFTPKHQPSNIPNWVYPSEQQYFNAMKVRLSVVHSYTFIFVTLYL